MHSTNAKSTRASRLEVFRRFVGHHDQTLSVLGAGLVLLTFVVKDGKSESLKSLIDSIDSARTGFLIRADIRNLHDDVRKLRPGLQDIWVKATGRTATRNEFQDGLDSWEDEFDGLFATTQALENVAEKLPPKTANLAQLWGLENRLLQNDNLDNEIGLAVESKDPASIDWIAIRQKYFKFIKESVTLTEEIGTQQKEILETAKVLLRQKEDQYRSYKTLGYCTFAFGWLLGLIGKISGVKGEA